MLTKNRFIFFKLFISLTLILLLSCAPLHTPSYTPQGEFATPDEILNSNNIERPTLNQQFGPFRLVHPVHNLRVNRGFIPSGRNEHHGLDISGRKNDPILAAHDGVVVYAGSGFRGYGKMILLEYNSQWASLYGHLNKFEVRTGDSVRAGQIIGRMGRTGRASGVHLHFELLKERQPVNPEAYFGTGGLVAWLGN